MRTGCLLLILVPIGLLFSLFGHLPFLILYGRHNYDLDEGNYSRYHLDKFSAWSFITIVSLFLGSVHILIPHLYFAVLIVIGIYNRKHKKVSFTSYGNIMELKRIKLFTDNIKHDYLMHNAPKSIVEYCDDHYGYDRLIYTKLITALSKRTIDACCAEILWERFNSNANPDDFPKIDFTALKDDSLEDAEITDKASQKDNITDDTAKKADEKQGRNRYACYSIESTHSTRYGKCIICKKESTLTLNKIKNSVGTRELYICDDCYRKFNSEAKMH